MHAPRTARRLAFLGLWCLHACAPQHPRLGSSIADQTLTQLRQEAAALLTERNITAWRTWRGEAPPGSAASYSGHEWIFAPKSIELVRDAARNATDLHERRALQYLHAYLLTEYVTHAAAQADDAVRAWELDAQLTVGDERIAYRDMPVRLANDGDPRRRRAILEALGPLLDQLNPLLLRRQHMMEQAARRLGYASYGALVGDIVPYDLQDTARLAHDVLLSTDGLYLSALEELAPLVVGVGRHEMAAADVPRLVKSAPFEDLFPAAQVLGAVSATLAGLGIQWSTLNLHVDDAPLPQKNPRAAVFPVTVPTDIRMSLKPIGGAADYEAMLHEVGHALHYALCERHELEFQRLGDRTTSEMFAFLLEGLMGNPTWLKQQLDIDDPALTRYVRLASLKKLYMVRRYAGKVLFELAWMRGDAEAKRGYREHLERAYGFPLGEVATNRYLVDYDPFLYAADYVRAWLLAAQVTADLERRYGDTWWNSAAAGDYLRQLWRDGLYRTGEEVAATLPQGSIRVTPLVQQLARNFVRLPQAMAKAQ